MLRRITTLSGAVAMFLICAFLPLDAREVSSYFSTSWTSFRDELPSDYILSMDFDKYGRLWIGTENGMASFDGTVISKYMRGTGAVSGNELNAVLADKFYDRVWFATKRDGLGFYDLRTGNSVFSGMTRPILILLLLMRLRVCVRMMQEMYGSVLILKE